MQWEKLLSATAYRNPLRQPLTSPHTHSLCLPSTLLFIHLSVLASFSSKKLRSFLLEIYYNHFGKTQLFSYSRGQNTTATGGIQLIKNMIEPTIFLGRLSFLTISTTSPPSSFLSKLFLYSGPFQTDRFKNSQGKNFYSIL